MTRWQEIADDLNHTGFTKDFLSGYMERGFGTLTKREIDLLVLQLLLKYRQQWTEQNPSDFAIAHILSITPRRVRTLLDEIDFRDEEKNEDWCRERLKEILVQAEKDYDKGQVRFQIDDGLVRAFATSEIRKAFGIVDTSFNRSIIRLSGERYAGLVLELMDQDERTTLIEAIPKSEREAQQNEQKSKGPIRLFIDSVLEGAGKEAGKKCIQIGVAALTGGASAALDIVDALGQKS